MLKLKQAATAWLAAGLGALVLLGASAPAGILLDVPFVKQEPEGCGAACISMVMQYWRKDSHHLTAEDTNAREIQRLLFNARAGGIVAADMQQYFREKGFQAFAFRGEWKDLENHLAKGRPVIVCLREGAFKHTLHYVVVTGIDGSNGVVFVNDPATRKLLKLDRDNFERRWSAMDHWALLAVPRQDL